MNVQAMPSLVSRIPYGPKSVGERAMRLAVGEASNLGGAMLVCSRSKILIEDASA